MLHGVKLEAKGKLSLIYMERGKPHVLSVKGTFQRGFIYIENKLSNRG
jgi:hypothetical protein